MPEESVLRVEWCSLCNQREAHGTLFIEEPVTKEEIPIPACVYCVANPDMNWKGNKLSIKGAHDD